MGHSRNLVFLLNGSSHGNSSRAAALRYPLVQSVACAFIHKFTSVCRDIHI